MSDILKSLVVGLLESYKDTGITNNVNGNSLPSKSAIGEITCDLLCLLLPGFFEEYPANELQPSSQTQILVASAFGRLEREIAKSLKFHTPARYVGQEVSKVASSVAAEFLAKFPEVRRILETDAEASFQGDPAAKGKEEVIVAYPFIEAIAVQRMAHILYEMQIAIIPRLMTEWVHSRTGIDIHPGAQIGSYFFIDHGTGTVIGETCRIGNHVKMFHGVTLGAKSTAAGQQLRGTVRHPKIEDDVTIYPGVTILGGDTVIGCGSTIGGNVFLTESVPAHSLVTQQGVSVKIVNKRKKIQV